jgi:DnaJ-class molecular chaperone
MNQTTARLVLGLQNAAPTLTTEIVVTAWRNAVKSHHPDTAELREFEAGDKLGQVVTIDTLTKAKKFLLDGIMGADFACGTCGGSGRVPGKLGLRECATCKGTGDKR